MPKRLFLAFLLLPASAVLLLSSLSHSASITAITEDISTLCKDKTIVLLGERHQQPNSQKLFIQLVQHYLNNGKRVFVGLEIPADEKIELDNALFAGGTDFSFIPSTIDHTAYRDMIHTLGKMKGRVTVQAIDAREEDVFRDKAMSRNLLSALASGEYDKILVLVGNLHAVKNITWIEDLNLNKQYLAGNLIGSGGEGPCSVFQLFRVGDGDDKKPVLMKIDTVKGSSLAMEIIKSVNHSDKMTGVDVGDAVIEWE